MSNLPENDISKIVEELLQLTPEKATVESQHVLELLAMTIFADKQVLSEEIRAFVRVVLRFQGNGTLSTELSEKDIISWYESHKDTLSGKLKHHNFEPWIQEKIAQLRDFPDKHQLLLAMDEIAQSDGEKHFGEEALEILTTNMWAEALLRKYTRKWVA